MNGQYRDGKILEVARRECGGQAYLDEALSARRVVEHGGLYYFRGARVGTEDIYERGEETKLQANIAVSDYEALVGAVDDIFAEDAEMLNSMNGGELSMSILGGGGSSGGQLALTAPTTAARGLEAAKKGLDEEHGNLSRAIKTAERCREMNLSTGNSFDRLARAMEQLSDTLENAEKLIMNVSLLLKFDKTQDGVKISEGQCEKLTQELVAMVQGLFADVKGFRCHLPKHAKKE